MRTSDPRTFGNARHDISAPSSVLPRRCASRVGAGPVPRGRRPPRARPPPARSASLSFFSLRLAAVHRPSRTAAPRRGTGETERSNLPKSSRSPPSPPPHISSPDGVVRMLNTRRTTNADARHRCSRRHDATTRPPRRHHATIAHHDAVARGRREPQRAAERLPRLVRWLLPSGGARRSLGATSSLPPGAAERLPRHAPPAARGRRARRGRRGRPRAALVRGIRAYFRL